MFYHHWRTSEAKRKWLTLFHRVGLAVDACLALSAE